MTQLSPQTAPLLEARNLRKYFKTRNGSLHAVDGVNLIIEEGTTLGVVGESGCGKSTLGRALLRLLEPTGGEVLFKGENILLYNAQKMKELRTKLQIIFQDPYSSLNPRMTVSQIIAEPIIVCHPETNARERERQVQELMDIVGLAERLCHAYPHELDGGRRQRIGVARALALSPELIVCDEPVSALDVSIQAQILNLMMDLQENRGLSYLFITHDLSVVKHISNRIMVMYLGECVESAPTAELFDNPLHPYTQALLDAIPVPSLSTRGQQKQLLKGELTSPINPLPRCRFLARCPRADAACEAIVPLHEVAEGHLVACVHV